MTQHTPVDAPAPAPASFPSSPLPHDREVRRESCSRSVPLQEGAVAYRASGFNTSNRIHVFVK
jgi:hypothetical protein